MLDLKFVIRNKELVMKALKERKIKGLNLDLLFSLSERKKRLFAKLDDLIKKKKIMTATIERAVTSKQNVNSKIVKKIKDLNLSIKNQEEAIKGCQQEIREFLVNLPNIPHPSVPEGYPGEPNKAVHSWGRKPKFNFSPRTYLEIGEKLGIIDFSKNSSILGFDVIYFKGAGARLQRALINFLMDLHVRNNYHELLPPLMSDGWPILKLIQGRVFDESELPLGYATYSLCLRKDWHFAQDIKDNLKRIRQFDSIELIKLAKPGNSYEILENMVSEAQEALKLLELPHEVTLFTRGNLDYLASKAYSIKVFFPGLDMSLETSVCSNLEDFFSKDMNITSKNNDDKQYMHILNARNLIIPRAMMAILEINQQSDASVVIPAALRPYLNGLSKIALKK